MDFIAMYKKQESKILTSLIVLITGVIVGGCLLFPRIFYDTFVWKYFWGPIVSDARGASVTFNGVVAADKFTWISEIVYALMIIVAVYLFFRLMKKWKVSFDWYFFAGLSPYIFFGTIARVLEDTGLFSEPLAYFFVTPLIYLMIFLVVVVFFILGHFLEKNIQSKHVKIHNVLFVSGFIFLMPILYYTAQWFSGNQWGPTNGVRFDIFILIFGLIAAIVFAVYIFARYFKDNEKIRVYSNPFNLALLVGHMIDGITTYISIYDPLGMGLPTYTEKHPASNILLNIWPPLFPIVKFLLIIIVIYVLDVLYKEELKNYRQFVNILKTVIFILGFAPGFRDLLRVMMGV